MITGTAFVDLSAAYDTVSYILLIQKLFIITQDRTLCRVIQNLLSNRIFYLELRKNEADGDYRRMACHKGVFSPQLFSNIYTNDQPVHYGTRSFIYADDLCITAQFHTFSQVENTIEEALGELTEYYRNNSLRANHDKTPSHRVSSTEQRGKEIIESIMKLS